MLWWRTAWRLSFLSQISPRYTPPSLATDCYVREIYILPRFSCLLPCIEPHSVVSYAFRELWVDNSSFLSQSPCLKPPPTESSGKDTGTARLHSLSCAMDKEQFLEKWRGPGSLEITIEKKNPACHSVSWSYIRILSGGYDSLWSGWLFEGIWSRIDNPNFEHKSGAVGWWMPGTFLW